MLIHRLRVSGLLSFGPSGIDLSMQPLNVLIGPNGSGKSNLLEVIQLFKSAPEPRGISEPISRMGGVRGWLWKGPEAPEAITMEAVVDYPLGETVRHSLTLADRNGRPEVTSEKIVPSGAPANSRAGLSYFRPPRNPDTEQLLRINSPKPMDPGSEGSLLAKFLDDGIDFRSDYVPDRSLVSLANPADYPALWQLHELYGLIRLYRNWSFGPSAAVRQPASAHDRPDYLEDGGSNLALVLSNFPGGNKRQLVMALRKLYDGIVDVKHSVVGGLVPLFLEEEGHREIPATRLSDGTLRYLCLLTILLHPTPPPLVAIEEPELGLHPDLLPTLADLLVEASERSQVIVTTHSDVLVDALTDTPESIVICEKHDGQTEMRRLDKIHLSKWLEEYRLGELWTSGELGGNRW